MESTKLVILDEDRTVTIRIDNINKLVHIQEQLDEEKMTAMLKFEEYMRIASKIMDDMSKSITRIS